MHEMMNYNPRLLFGEAWISKKGGYKVYFKLENGIYEARKVHYPPLDIPEENGPYKPDLDNPWSDNFFWPCMVGRATKLETAILICEAESKNFVSAYWWSPGDESGFDAWTCKCHRINIFKMGTESERCDNCGREEENGRVGKRASEREAAAKASVQQSADRNV